MTTLSDLVAATSQPAPRVSADVVIVAYDAATQTATIRPVVAEPYLSDSGVVEGVVLPEVPGCPVAWPSGGGRSLCWGLSPGDRAKAIVRTVSHDEADSGANAPVTPSSTRRLDWSDAWVVPGDATPASPLPTSSYREDGQPVLALGAGEQLHLGVSTATLRLVVAEALRPFLADLKTWLDSHTHPTPAGASSAPTSPSPSVPTIAQLGSGRVRVDS